MPPANVDLDITFGPVPVVQVNHDSPRMANILVQTAPEVYVSAPDAGSYGFVWKGAWSAVVSYFPYDVVSYGTASYISISANSNKTPGTSPDWELFVLGQTGPQGPKGDTGPQGVGISVKGTVPSSAYLPQEGNTVGDMWIAADSGHGWAWQENETWLDIGPVQGPVGPTGPQGVQGVAGARGMQGAVGPQGSQGAPGAAGAPGMQGATGPQGNPGPQGVPGSTGPTGPQGVQGIVGPTGPKGADGTSVVLKGSVATQSALPATGNTYGDLWVTTDTGNGWVWSVPDPGHWANVGPIQGPVGPQGPAGSTGSMGNAATIVVGSTTTGAAGSSAVVTNIGSVNAAILNFTVPQGIQGAQGAQGPQGNPGAAGGVGPQGLQGNVGPQGSTGPQGVQGVKGDKGDTGATGSQGSAGATGPQGPPGSTALVSTSAPGLAPTLDNTVTHFLDGTGNWSAPAGGGDMMKSVYDTNSDGIVDHAALADAAPWGGITSKPATFPPDSTAMLKAVYDTNADGIVDKAAVLSTPGTTHQFWKNGNTWGQVDYSDLTGVPAIPNVGTLTAANSITGGGAMTGNITISLVGDTASPGNNAIYGTSGVGARGWLSVSALPVAYASLTGVPTTFAPDSTAMLKSVYDANTDGIVDKAAALSTAGAASQFWKNGNSWGQVAYTDLTGVPAIPTVGTLTTANSITGGGAMTGNLTIALVGDSASPGNNAIYGTSGTGTRGWLSITTLPVAWSSLTGTQPAPPSHAASHAHGGSDAVTVTYADLASIPSTFAPSAHAVNHKSGGSDVIALDTLGATTDITTLNSSTTAHGLLPKLSNVATQFLNGTGGWTVPTASAAGVYTTATTASFTIPAAAATVAIAITSATWGKVGQLILISDGTSFVLAELTTRTSNTAWTMTNRPLQGNAVSGTMGSGATVTLVGPGQATTTQGGLLPTPPNDATKFLNGVAAFTALPAASLGAFIESPSNKTYTLEIDAPAPFTVIKLSIKTVSGTCTVALTRNGTGITNATAVSVSSTLFTVILNQACVAGDIIAMVVSANSSAVDLSATVRIQP
jgi:collagen type VII alpha